MDKEQTKRKRPEEESTRGASSSSCISPEATGLRSGQYDVFLNFRGSDTRKTFTDHLYRNLVKAGTVPFCVFRDENSIPIGEEFGSEILDAIVRSKISIPVISENYASSKWCLRELVHIMECKKSMQHIVLPIFYKVAPSDVRHLKGNFGNAFHLRWERYDEKDIQEWQQWQQALNEVSYLHGWESDKFEDGHEGELIEHVVETVRSKLQEDFQLNVPKQLVGLDDGLKKIMNWIDSPSINARMIGIYGMGGIGKTTLAKIIHNQLSNKFGHGHVSFLPDVRETTERYGITYLQSQLISDILRSKNKVSRVDDGINIIKSRFKGKKVLILLDDIDDKNQLDALAGERNWFMVGSLIIVTTRNEAVLDQSEFEVDYKYELNGLDKVHALLLFNRHAFRVDHSPKDFDGLSRDIISTMGGLPLALEVVGSYLYKNKNKGVWEDVQKKLKNQPHRDVQKILQISYDALEDGHKQIFLDIACFFIDIHDNGKAARSAMYMWEDCGFYPNQGIEELKLRCLIKIGDNGEFMMHDQLRDLGRSIFCQGQPLKKCSGPWDDKYAGVPRVLRHSKHFKKLKIICLTKSQVLVYMPNLSCTPYLEELYLQECKNLEHVHESVAYHGNLRILNLRECSKLRHFLTVLQTKNLQFLDLSGCSQLQRFPDIPDKMEELRTLYLNGTSIEELPASIENLVSLKDMDLMNCQKLAILPSSIYRLQNIERLRLAGCSILIKFPKEENSSDPHMKTGFPKLQYLNLSGCNLLEVEFLENYSCFPFLRFLSLSRNNFTKLPTCGHLKNLRSLDVSYCQQLQEILKIPGQLCYLRAAGCQSLSKIPSNIRQVDNIDLRSCHELIHNGFTMNDLFKPEWRLKHEDIQTSAEEDSSSKTKDLLDSQTSTEEDGSSILVNKELNMADFTFEEYRYSRISPDYQNVLPGEEMPKEFVLVEDNTISFMASQDLYDRFLGLTLCVVFSIKDRKKEVSFDIVPYINGQRRNVLSGTLGLFDSEHIWIQYLRPNMLWGVLEGGIDFGEFDKNYLRFSLRVEVSGGTVKKLGYVIRCRQLEDDLKVVLKDNQLVNLASLCEDSDESLDSKAISCQSVSKIPSDICDIDTVDLSSCGFTRNDLFELEQFRPKTGCQVLLPGGEMPKWLLPNKNGYISFMASKDLYKKFLGLAFCVVFRAKEGKKQGRFELLACVDGKMTHHHYRTFSSIDLDHEWLAFHKTEALWRGDTFGPNDSIHFHFSIRALDGTIVKRCGLRLLCKPLDNNLEILLQDNQLLDPALLYEIPHENSQTSTKEDSSCKLANMADFSLQEVWVKDEAKEPVVHIGNSYRESPHVAIEYLVGIDKQVEDMMDLLDLEVSDIRIVGIWGKGGVGKTTLARIIYKQISSRFDSCSFLADIETTTKQFGGVQFLQSKLLSDILKQEHEVDHVAKGVNFFKEVLRNIKVLIVLDDVEVQSHLCKIIGEKLDWFGYGSRIIVTTSDVSILPKFIPRGLALDYKINVINNDQALELFQKHALRRNLPVPGFDEAAKDIINSVNGIPILIEVIGSLLDRKLVEQLIAREEPILPFDLRIQEILQVSYEELSEVQREMLLDIACLPADVDCRIASFMWHNPHFPLSDGVDALRVKSLVKIGRNNELGMHRLLREFGQRIIRREDHLDPGRRGRLCNLSWNIEKMEGTEHLNFVAEDFKSMPNIRFLILDRANIDGDFANVFPNLKWLQWQGCTGDFKATNFHVEKLVILDLSWSKVTEDWGGWREIKMPQLKVLNLTGCADLLISPDLSSFTALEILILERCSQLVKLDPSIHHLKYLASLNLRFCNELSMLPIELSHLKALKELLIDGTSVQEIPVSMGYMEELEIFSASNCLQLSHLPDSLCDLTALSVLLLENAKIARIPDSAEKLVKLRDLSLKNCRWIERLPDLIGNLERLEQLDITGTGISKLPDSITRLRCLKVLKMDSCFIRELPREIGNLANLEELHASYCRSLKGAIPNAIKSLDHLRILRLGHSSISGLPSEIVSLSCLQTLDLLRCNKIQALPELPSSLTCLRVSSERMKALPDLKFMVKLEEICLGDTDPKELICASTWKKPRSRLRDTLVVPVGLPKLKILELSHSKISNLSFRQGSLSCTHLKKLVLSGVNLQEVSVLPVSLSVLSIQRCFSLKGLPAVGNLRTLSEINLIQSAVEEIKGLEGLIALEVLNIAYCEIRNLNGLGQLSALRRLVLSDCDSLDELPDISDLKMLNVLEVQRCKIHDIEGLKELTSLEVLHVSECEAEKTQQVKDALKRVMA